MGFVLGAKSLRNLNGVHEDLVRVVKHAITLTAVDFTVLCGLRTVAEQKVLVATGKSTTMRSRHLTGHAVDLAPWPINWNDLNRFHQVVDAMKEAAEAEHVPIECGADWKSFIDMPHFQLPWKEYP